MHVEWPDGRCILCHSSENLSKEHLIPDALGGILTCDFLCRVCNSTLGATFESTARTDPSVRLAVQRLDGQIPDLADKLKENQSYFVDGADGRNHGTIRDGAFRIKARTADDGSLIQPTDIARKSIANILRKSGMDDAPIAAAQRLLDEAPENQRVELGPTLEVVKWSVEKIHLDLSTSRLMNPLVPVKIAFEFLACHLGGAIYADLPPLIRTREAIRNMDAEDPSFNVERLNAEDYKPFHGICFEGNSPHAKVLIRLFGWLAFRVHFLQMSVGGDRYVYTHYLDTGREDIRVVQ